MTDPRLDDTSAADAKQSALFPLTAGERLRAAREAAGLDLADIATRTRVPLRHLAAIERSDYSGLPTSTYAIGFARSYARVVGVDEKTITSDVRRELGQAANVVSSDAVAYAPADPTRLPSRLLAWTAIAVLVLLAIGYAIWRNQTSGSDVTAPIVAPAASTLSATPNAAPPSPAAAPRADGQVSLTATLPVWVRIYDRDRKRLFQRELAAGERYDVPANAVDPMILTARPDALTVAIDGRAVAPLATSQVTVRDLPVSATALLARPAADTRAVSPERTAPGEPASPNTTPN